MMFYCFLEMSSILMNVFVGDCSLEPRGPRLPNIAVKPMNQKARQKDTACVHSLSAYTVMKYCGTRFRATGPQSQLKPLFYYKFMEKGHLR